MGWRKVLESAMEWELPRQAREEIASEMHAGLLAMPAADRIAMARELLAGTRCVVARDVKERTVPDKLQGTGHVDRHSLQWEVNGWNAARKAMREDTP